MLRNAVSEAGKQAALAQQAAAQKQAAAKQAAFEKQAAAKQAALAKQSPAANQASAPAAGTCLTKEYLVNGAVKFTDTCTGEWAQRP